MESNSHSEVFDWVLYYEQHPRHFHAAKWLAVEPTIDRNAHTIQTGLLCRTLVSSRAFDEKGCRFGIFPSETEFRITLSDGCEPPLLYFEGMSDKGWGMTAVLATDVEVNFS